MTGRPLPNAVISIRNVTRLNSTHARDDIIKHDVTSGNYQTYQIISHQLSVIVVISYQYYMSLISKHTDR